MATNKIKFAKIIGVDELSVSSSEESKSKNNKPASHQMAQMSLFKAAPPLASQKTQRDKQILTGYNDIQASLKDGEQAHFKRITRITHGLIQPISPGISVNTHLNLSQF